MSDERYDYADVSLHPGLDGPESTTLLIDGRQIGIVLKPAGAVELASALVDWAQQQTHSHALYVAAQYLDQYQAHPEGDPA